MATAFSGPNAKEAMGGLMIKLLSVASVLALSGLASGALANNVGENYAWQFETTADKVNKAAIADMIEKKESGYYAPPVYNTYIDRQYNCSVASTATGNEGTNTNLANSPTTSGPHSNATGNDNVGLSERRNTSTENYLVGKGIPKDRITSQGFGEANPRVPTADGVRELQNRRVEITYGPGSGN
jgi:hypothetical protein